MKLKYLFFIIVLIICKLTISQTPIIKSFSPSFGCSGTVISIHGINFSRVNSVKIGSAYPTSVKILSDTLITATVGVGSRYTGSITVTSVYGFNIGSSADNFIYGSGIVAYAFILNSKDSTVSVVNTVTNTVTKNIKVGNGPCGVCLSQDGKFVYITNGGSNTVSVISTDSNAVISTIAVGNSPQGIAINPWGGYLYVTNYSSNTVSVISTSTNAVVATIPVGNGPQGVLASSNNIYVANLNSNTVSVLNYNADTVISTINVGSYPGAICSSPDASTIFVTNYQSNNVSVINTTSNTITNTIAVGILPEGIVASPDGLNVYVTNVGSNSISVINTQSNTVTSSINVGINPVGISISSDGNTIYVANNGSNTMSIINVKNDSIIATVSVGKSPLCFGNFIAYIGTPCFTNYYIEGNVISPLNKIINGAKITFNGVDSIFNGTYYIAETFSTPIKIKLSKNNDINKTNGITTLDMALIQSHILGKNKLNSPYKLIAADVNGDGKVTTLDIVYLKRLILGLDTTFTKTSTGEKRLWAFIDSSYQFPDTTNPFPFKDSIIYTGLSTNKTNQTFIGVKLGDVNWDWNPALARMPSPVFIKPKRIIMEE